MSRLLRLYPRAWRARYGEELEDLLAARPLRFSGAVDLVRGALDAHRHPELVDPGAAPTTGHEPITRQRYEDLQLARRLGNGSLLGAALWVIAWVVATNGPVVGTGDDAYVDGMAAMPIFLAAMVLLSAGLCGHLLRLPATARIARFGAAVAILSGPVWAMAPWIMVTGVLTILGVAAVAIGGWWSSSWSGLAAAALLATVAGTVGALAVALGLSQEFPMVAMVLLATPMWLVVGGTLQGVPDPSDVEPDRGTDAPASGIAPA